MIISLVPQKLKNYFKHLPFALAALWYYRFPGRKIKIIGVTGTDGKTTTVSLIYHILIEAGYSAAMISTVSAKIKNDEIDTGFHVTAPNPWFLQKLLKKMEEEKIEYLVLEVTSHGLDQFRLLGINFEIGVITNITHEHLDYHKTFKKYLLTKAKMFYKSKKCILNRDDVSFGLLSKICLSQGKKCITYGIKNPADFSLDKFKFKTVLAGEYNLYNCLATAATCYEIGVPEEKIKEAIASFEGIVGRNQEINLGQKFRVIVDFAHTPNALKQLLATLKGQIKGKSRLIVVFGAAGLRDKEKRPMMGEVAGKYADLVVLTAEDPRTEKVEDICEQISIGYRKTNRQPVLIYNREKAIKYAIGEAKDGDVVVVCGKGHEKSMSFGAKEYPWSDQEATRKALQSFKKGGPA